MKSSESIIGDFDILPHGLGKWRDVVKKDVMGDEDLTGLAAPSPNGVGLGKLATAGLSPEHVDPVVADLAGLSN